MDRVNKSLNSVRILKDKLSTFDKNPMRFILMAGKIKEFPLTTKITYKT